MQIIHKSPTSVIACTLLLFCTQTVPAQEKSVPTKTISTKETVLFDFEGGNFDGWTLTGDCWDKAPATPKTFVDKAGNSLVSGILGKGFLTTLYKDATTMGKAVSKDFTIDKPFLTFKIGGGHYPKEACLNLIIDGKIVRTETGNDSPDLIPAYWDVYVLMGKTAHLEVVDTAITPSPDRSYIMLDEVRLSERPNTKLQIIFENLAEKYRAKYGSPGVWLGASVDGKLVACTAIGVRKLGSDVPANVDDIVMVGSISKPMTGTVIASLVKAGKLSWDTTPAMLIPNIVRGFTHPSVNATVAQFMSHTSGIDVNHGKPKDDAGTPTKWRELEFQAALSVPPVGQVGEVFKYAAGADFVGVMAEQITGRSFESLFDQYLVKPFGLRKFGMGDKGRNDGEPNTPRGHHIDRDKHFIGYGDDRQYHNLRWRSELVGGVSCSFLDLLRFGAVWSMGAYKEWFPKTLDFEDATTVPFSTASYTRSGWGKWGGGLWHGGNTGRGEEANIQVDYPKRISFALYFNMNYPDENFQLGDDLIPEMRNAILVQYPR